jgi:hypothetical protein
MSLDLYPSIIHEGDLSPDAVGDDINETVEVRSSGKIVLRFFLSLFVFRPKSRTDENNNKLIDILLSNHVGHLQGMQGIRYG